MLRQGLRAAEPTIRGGPASGAPPRQSLREQLERNAVHYPRGGQAEGDSQLGGEADPCSAGCDIIG